MGSERNFPNMDPDPVELKRLNKAVFSELIVVSRLY
jgi:hypothetical protein